MISTIFSYPILLGFNLDLAFYQKEKKLTIFCEYNILYILNKIVMNSKIYKINPKEDSTNEIMIHKIV